MLLLNNFQQAFEYANQALDFVDDTFGNIISVPLYVLYILSYHKHRSVQSSLMRYCAVSERYKYGAAFKALRKIAQHNPKAFSALLLICEAERCRVEKSASAMRVYDRAMSAVDAGDYPFIRGLIYDFAAQFYAENNAFNPAIDCMNKAITTYRDWGAHRKVAQLLDENANLRLRAGWWEADARPEVTQSHQPLDLEAVLKASQVLSKEIEIDQVLAKLMEIVITVAGAGNGYLILDAGDTRYIRSMVLSESDLGASIHQLPVKDYQNIAHTVLNYVYRTGKTVLLGNAVEQGLFKTDVHIREQGIKSLICLGAALF